MNLFQILQMIIQSIIDLLTGCLNNFSLSTTTLESLSSITTLLFFLEATPIFPSLPLESIFTTSKVFFFIKISCIQSIFPFLPFDTSKALSTSFPILTLRLSLILTSLKASLFIFSYSRICKLDIDHFISNFFPIDCIDSLFSLEH